MLEVFEGEVKTSPEIQKRRNELMRERTNTQIEVMANLGYSLDDSGLEQWKKDGFAERYAEVFEEAYNNTETHEHSDIVKKILDKLKS